jgi:hypothetical protein
MGVAPLQDCSAPLGRVTFGGVDSSKKRTLTAVLTHQESPVFAAHLVVTLLASVVYGSAAIANFIGHDYPTRQADKMRVPRSWMVPLGALLAAGALGLVAGLAVPVVGTFAAAGLVLYFLGAFGAHLRVSDYELGGWGVCFGLALAALITNLATNGPGDLAM